VRCPLCGVPGTAERCPRCQQSARTVPLQTPFWGALWAVPRGLITLLADRRLWGLSLLPLALAVVLLATGVGLGLSRLQGFLAALLTGYTEGTWLWVLQGLSFLLSSVLGVFLFLVLFLPVVSLVCMPFLEPLALAAEEYWLGGASPSGPGLGLGAILADMLRLLVFKLALMLLALPLLLIPGLGFLLYLWIMAMLTAIDFWDLTLGRKHYRFGAKLAFIRRHAGAFMAFSLPLMLMVWIPVLQLLMVPAGAVAGALLYLQLPKQEPSDASVAR
jgi:CysZ protein